jgi:hypothetical protein
MIERLTRLHIDGDPTVYPALAKEWERRGERWCGGGKPPITHATIEDLAKYLKTIRPFNQPIYLVESERDSADIYRDAAWSSEYRWGRQDMLARFAIAIDGTAWAAIVFGDIATEDLDLSQFEPCSHYGVGFAPHNMQYRTQLCRQSKRGTHNSRRQCCPIQPHQGQQPTPAEAL